MCNAARGGAVVRAAEALIRQIREQPARVLGVDEKDVEFDGESVRCGEQEMTVAALANKLICFGLRTGSLMTYKLPTRRDVPEPRVEFMPSFEPTAPSAPRQSARSSSTRPPLRS
ncbi:MAG: hypothetical protein Q4B91_00150 [Atopobiaceae bacterium]|nr:hypothetical protein [Atopobiaceae bacterium]